MTTDDDTVTRRAVEAIHATSETDAWPAVSATVRDRVRRTPRLSQPVHASTHTLSGTARFAPSDRLDLSDTVVVDVLRQALHDIPGTAPHDIALTVDAGRCVGVRVDIVSAFGTDLLATAGRVRSVVGAALSEALGTLSVIVPVDVAVVDVVVDDPSP